VGRRGSDHISCAQRNDAEDNRKNNTETIGQATHQHAAEAEADHGQCIRKGCRSPGNTELSLQRRQRDDHRPHACAADGRETYGGGEAQPRVGRFELCCFCSAGLRIGFASGLRPPHRIFKIPHSRLCNRCCCC
jgi:hypothetical protein